MSTRPALSTAVVVIGASGKTGQLIVRQLLKEGHYVRAISRTPPHALPLEEISQMTFVSGDLSKDDPDSWMSGMDAAVYTAAGGDALTEDVVDHLGAARCAMAAKEAGVERFVLVSAHGAHDPTSWGAEFRSYLEAKAAGEAAVRASFPEATIVRPGILSDAAGNRRATIRASTGPGDVTVTRADVAMIVASCAVRDNTRGATLEVVGGDTEIEVSLGRCIVSVAPRGTKNTS